MAPDLPPHWLHPPDIAAARAAQLEMAARVVVEDDLPARFQRLGGADVSNTRFDPAKRVHAALVTLDATTDAVLAVAAETRRADFPYVPGYLGFREVPALRACWSRLAVPPEVILVDGHGMAHPRGIGIACQLGVVLGVPTIGVAKSLLVGEHGPLGDARGATAELRHKGEVVGMAVRTRKGVSPVYVSPGHLMDLPTAVDIILRVSPRFREPETTRHAHRLVNALRLARGEAAELGGE